MIKIASIRPPDRMSAIKGWRSELAYERQNKIKMWGLQINKNLIQLQARVLPPPRILYDQGKAEVQASEGGWNIRGNKVSSWPQVGWAAESHFFRQGKKPLVAWSFISFDRWCDEDDMRRYCAFLVGFLQRFGVDVPNKNPVCIGPVDPRQPENVVEALKRASKAAYTAGKCAPQLICIVLPGRWVS